MNSEDDCIICGKVAETRPLGAAREMIGALPREEIMLEIGRSHCISKHRRPFAFATLAICGSKLIQLVR
jgi:hypothetical protein